MRNVEFKAELRDPAIAKEVCRSLGAAFIGVIDQTDTYYRIPAGRLKKRESTLPGGGSEVEYIFYERPNTVAPKLSIFKIYSPEQANERFGSTPLPVLVIVVKRRTLYMLDNTRIHLDDVTGLGKFMEFEYLISKDNPIEEGRVKIAGLRQAFAFAMGEPIDRSYSDMLLVE